MLPEISSPSKMSPRTADHGWACIPRTSDYYVLINTEVDTGILEVWSHEWLIHIELEVPASESMVIHHDPQSHSLG
ncbi:hypothetical protein ALP45_01632 [Pseudomonas coronafaciens pv. atropurpurea]|nr:Unknown protein sequence [Pseudomonas coronafaciens pv. atropurpurea]RMT56283.1 hypothetical protein ALP45_01632 [Pseudomonas coronafaciens pv. atropurpurea]